MILRKMQEKSQLSNFKFKKKVKTLGFQPKPDHLFEKRWNKNFIAKAQSAFVPKFLRFLGTFFKKFLSGVWGNAPRHSEAD